MGDPSQELYETALEAIRDIFEDGDSSPEERIENLRGLIDEINDLIQATN